MEAENEGTQSELSRKISSRKYAALRPNLNEEDSSKDLNQEGVSSSLTNDASSSQNITSPPSSALASKWTSMMHGLKSFRSNMDSNRFIPLGNAQTSTHSHPSSESLDDIFERLKLPPSEHRDSGD